MLDTGVGSGGGGARAALAAKRRSGACGREGEREREEIFAATMATGGEEKERSTVRGKRVER